MVYLHKSVFQSHGYLSSANCHVDSRWVLKVSGFALHAFRKQDCKEQVNVNVFSNLDADRCISSRIYRIFPPGRRRYYHHLFYISLLQSPLGIQWAI